MTCAWPNTMSSGRVKLAATISLSERGADIKIITNSNIKMIILAILKNLIQNVTIIAARAEASESNLYSSWNG